MLMLNVSPQSKQYLRAVSQAVGADQLEGNLLRDSSCLNHVQYYSNTHRVQCLGVAHPLLCPDVTTEF